MSKASKIPLVSKTDDNYIKSKFLTYIATSRPKLIDPLSNVEIAILASTTISSLLGLSIILV
jgi:hypothetical protein